MLGIFRWKLKRIYIWTHWSAPFCDLSPQMPDLISKWLESSTFSFWSTPRLGLSPHMPNINNKKNGIFGWTFVFFHLERTVWISNSLTTTCWAQLSQGWAWSLECVWRSKAMGRSPGRSGRMCSGGRPWRVPNCLMQRRRRGEGCKRSLKQAWQEVLRQKQWKAEEGDGKKNISKYKWS